MREVVERPRRGDILRCLTLGLPILASSAFAPLQPRLSAKRGELRLEVRDGQGATLAARGELVSRSNQFSRTFDVGSDGRYAAQDLPFGVERSGQRSPMATWVRNAFSFSAGLEVRNGAMGLASNECLAKLPRICSWQHIQFSRLHACAQHHALARSRSNWPGNQNR